MYLSHAFEEAKPIRKRRRVPRFDVQCRARIRIGTRQYAGYIHNISCKGAKLRTISSIRKLGNVMLRLPDLPLMRCRLVWTDAYHAGVQFERPLTKVELQQWMAARSACEPLKRNLEAECAEVGELAAEAAI